LRDLHWPPTENDLRRLYCGQKLSAAKIADVYGLKYPNPKSGETLVLYHLRKFGIARRDRAEHIRKVTAMMVDNWAKRYQAGESLKRIAGTEVDAVTVWTHLRKRGIALRNKVEAQIASVTKHVRKPFAGARSDQAYLIGFARGDLNVSTYGRAVRVKTSTTHPLMTELVDSLFKENGFVRVTPRYSTLTGYEWNAQVDLDGSFSFPLDFKREIPSWVFEGEFIWDFVAGFFDAEGSVTYGESIGYGFQVTLTNADFRLLRRIANALKSRGFHPYLGVDKTSNVWRIQIWRKAEVERLLRLLPLRHAEKTSKALLVLQYGLLPKKSDEASHVIEAWRLKIEEIERARNAFVAKARAGLNAR
jgi:intein-encoded DNA endonuclease-like protein